MGHNLFRAAAMTACLLSFFTPAEAVPGDKQSVTDAYGHKVTIEDSDDQLPKYALIGKAYQVALYKDVATDVMFGQINKSDYAKYASDKDLGPFIEVAKADKRSAIVLILPSTPEAKTRVVFFKGAQPVSYAEGRNVSAADLRRSLVALPEKLPPVPGMDDGGAMRLRPYNVFADNGDALTVFKIMHTGKPEIPWTFGDAKATQPASPQQ